MGFIMNFWYKIWGQDRNGCGCYTTIDKKKTKKLRKKPTKKVK